MANHERYWFPFKNRGTPPRRNTMRRLAAQAALGLPKLTRAVRQHGNVIHPTKGHAVSA